MAVEGGFPWDAAITQIQMTCDDIVVDRYDLSAQDLSTIQQELAGVLSSTGPALMDPPGCVVPASYASC